MSEVKRPDCAFWLRRLNFVNSCPCGALFGNKDSVLLWLPNSKHGIGYAKYGTSFRQFGKHQWYYGGNLKRHKKLKTLSQHHFIVPDCDEFGDLLQFLRSYIVSKFANISFLWMDGKFKFLYVQFFRSCKLTCMVLKICIHIISLKTFPFSKTRWVCRSMSYHIIYF